MRPIHAFLALLPLLPVSAPVAGVDLPAIGDPADRALSPHDEARIGRQVMRQVHGSLATDRDAQVTAYIDHIGQRLARHAGEPPIDGYTFFVVHDSRINAFAAPGGYIGVNSGLIREAANEAQLAGVMSHEIAHVSQRHIARMYATAGSSGLTTLATVLAGILVGASNPQAGQAAIMAGVGRQAQSQIDYTRTVEYEADRIGIRILADAGYDPEGMAEFFEVLLRQEMGAVDAAPEYLRTHPLSSNRVAEARDRAAQIPRGDDVRRDSLDFQLMRARLTVVDARSATGLHDRWQRTRVPDEPYLAAARSYGLALLELALERPDEATERIDALLQEYPDNRHLLLASAAAAHAGGDSESALTILAETAELHPGYWPLAKRRALLLMEMDRPDEAARLLTEFTRSHRDAPPPIWHTLGRAAEAAGQPLRSHEALAEYYFRAHAYSQAAGQLRIALRYADRDTAAYHRLQARLDQMEGRHRQQLEDDPVPGG